MHQIPCDLENNHVSMGGFIFIIISKRNSSFLFLFYCYMIYSLPVQCGQLMALPV